MAGPSTGSGGRTDLESARRSMLAAHRPGASVAGPYGRPFHPMIVTVPIGAFVCTVAFDVASKLSDGRDYARAASWLCAIGVVSALVAAATGLIDIKRLTPGTEAHRHGLTHRNVMLLAVVLFVVSFVLRRVDADSASYLEDGTPTVAMILAVVGLVLVAVGGSIGGKLVFAFGARVADESDQLRGHMHSGPTSAPSGLASPQHDASRPASTEPDELEESTS